MIKNLKDTKHSIQISSLANNGATVYFFPYDLEFDDIIRPDFTKYDSFGRMDSMMIYKKTSRDMNVSFNVVADDDKEAAVNLAQLNKLIRFLYPIYTTPVVSDSQQTSSDRMKQEVLDLDNKQLINQSFQQEFVTVNGNNNTQTPIANSDPNVAAKLITNQQIASEESGYQIIQKAPILSFTYLNLFRKENFVAAVTNFKYKLVFDSSSTIIDYKKSILIPGTFNISIGFTVLHTYLPGTRDVLPF